MIAMLAASPLLAENYILTGWNDLGMHCANQDFSTLVVLPPFNNVHAQAIRVGSYQNPPQIVTQNLYVTYEIPGNTYSVGKTNFWSYAQQIFGVNLPPNIGLTGNGLTGMMTPDSNNFIVTGIPITPYTDADLVHEDPFQLGLLKLYNQNDSLLATAQPVIPVSNEISCVSAGCHSSMQGILNRHDNEGGFDPNARPVLCATCHSSNALGTPGHPGLPSLSQVIHQSHGGRTNDCYKCHPGPSTRCLRDIMSTRHNMTCQNCHGSVSNVGNTIENGRNPWLQEPSCGAAQCHGSQYAEEPGKLYRNSRGHGGLFCSVCHGEPHAIVKSRVDRDNVENINLQGYAGTLNKCETCHGIIPAGAGPHGIQLGDAAPQLGSVVEPNIYPGGHGAVRVSATDVNGDPITLSAELLPPHANFVDSTGGIGGLTFDPDLSQIGSFHVRIIAHSTTKADSQIVTLTVIDTTFVPRNFVLIGWNDLGMHCANQDFSKFVVLPPFNNVHAQAIQVGDSLNPPQILTTGYHVTYEIPGNTYSIGKTNFWDYDQQIFGVNLPDNVGLTGNGMSGNMVAATDNFVVTGIPITPYTDADLTHEDPFQLGLLKLYDSSNQLLATAPPVVPVSNEISCISFGCHTSAQSILTYHAEIAGFNPNAGPILCATCHGSNALGMPGNPNLPSLSQAVHQFHGTRTNDCYKCHPGSKTSCLRDAMSTRHGMTCQNCHGSVTDVGTSIANGRQPWLQEPSCGAAQCHGARYAEQPGQLYRNSKGHGGMFCSACHGEPHAILTSRIARDNVQNIALQSQPGTLSRCITCHGVTPNGPGPHDIITGDQPPILATIPQQSVHVGGHLGIRVTATDANSDPITLTAQLLPLHASFSDSTGGVGGLTFDPDSTQVGPHSIRLIASSTTLADTEMVSISVITGGPGCSYVVGDANGSGTFTGLDVTYSVRYFKGGSPPSYSCECTPGHIWYVSGDVNGSCTFSGLDVTYMVRYFKGGPAAMPCPDCPPIGLMPLVVPNHKNSLGSSAGINLER